MKRYPTTLIIAGSDSCGGAGIQADIKACAALGIYATTAITAVTAQNTHGVRDIQPIDPHIVRAQIEAVLDDIPIDCIKIGMLCNADIALTVANTLQKVKIPIVLDPVMVSTSGHQLLTNDAIDIIVDSLFPLAHLITPNTHEATLLTGIDIATPAHAIEAGKILLAKGCQATLMKGGHIAGNEVVDILMEQGKSPLTLTTPTIATRNTHGTGCTLASAIAAYVARGCDRQEAVSQAKRYVYNAISHGADNFVGNGHGAPNHAFAPLPLQAVYNYNPHKES